MRRLNVSMIRNGQCKIIAVEIAWGCDLMRDAERCSCRHRTAEVLPTGFAVPGGMRAWLGIHALGERSYGRSFAERL